MTTRPWRQRFILFLAAALGVAVAVWLWPRPAPPPESGQLLLDNLVVSYQVGVVDGDYMVSYSYPAVTAAEVRAAQAGLRQTAAAWAAQGRSFKATLVFTQPLLTYAFSALARQTGLLVYSATGRAGQSEMRLPPQPGGAALDPLILSQALADPSIIRIISTDVALDPAAFARLAPDARIAAIDIVQQALLDQVQHDYPNAAADRIFVQLSGLYGRLAQAGLVATVSPATQATDVPGGH
jgi:hypothetical protein